MPQRYAKSGIAESVTSFSGIAEGLKPRPRCAMRG
jgi:hypothetical protein